MGVKCVSYTGRMLRANPEWMRQVIRLASENVTSGGGGPFAALIVKDGAVVAEGVNTVVAANDPTAHAEIDAIRAACAAIGEFSLRGCEIYINSEPCPMCLAAIYWARLDAMYFGAGCEDAAQAGFDDGYIFGQLSLERSERAIPSEQLLREEALESFRLWEKSPFKKEY